MHQRPTNPRVAKYQATAIIAKLNGVPPQALLQQNGSPGVLMNASCHEPQGGSCTQQQSKTRL